MIAPARAMVAPFAHAPNRVIVSLHARAHNDAAKSSGPANHTVLSPLVSVAASRPGHADEPQMGLRISFFVLAALLLGAHFLRAGNLAMVAFCLAAPLLFLYRRRRSLIALQILAYGAGATWIAVAMQMVRLRQQLGQPWTVAALILGAVALLTLLAGLLLNSRAIRERYPK